MKKTIVLFVLFPLLVAAQEKPICTKTEVALDTVHVYNDAYFIGRVIAHYLLEDAEHLTSAFVMVPLQDTADKPVLFYSNLLQDSSLADVLTRLRSGSWQNASAPDDTTQLGEVTDLAEIRQLYHNIFEITQNQWHYYPGAAHGYGHTRTFYFNVTENAYFNFDDVFESEVYPFLQEILKAHIKEEFEHWEIEDEEERINDIAEVNYELEPDNYAFSHEGLLIQAQMYQSLFGWIEMGYNYFGVEIPWEALQPYVKPGNPLEKMLE